MLRLCYSFPVKHEDNNWRVAYTSWQLCAWLCLPIVITVDFFLCWGRYVRSTFGFLQQSRDYHDLSVQNGQLKDGNITYYIVFVCTFLEFKWNNSYFDPLLFLVWGFFWWVFFQWKKRVKTRKQNIAPQNILFYIILSCSSQQMDGCTDAGQRAVTIRHSRFTNMMQKCGWARFPFLFVSFLH